MCLVYDCSYGSQFKQLGDSRVTDSAQFIAHRREATRGYPAEEQELCDHLNAVSTYAGRFARKIGLENIGVLLGLLHDLGKYSPAFQRYIRSALGLLNPDIDEDYVDSARLRGKIDHSTAGAQWLWEKIADQGAKSYLLAQVICLCLVSHHGGLIDCLHPSGEKKLRLRIRKDTEQTHLHESIENADSAVIEKAVSLIDKEVLSQSWSRFPQIVIGKYGQHENEKLNHFRIGFLVRFLFSCLVDADRIDSANFENPGQKSFRMQDKADWDIPIDRLETKLAGFTRKEPIDSIRAKISESCYSRSSEPQGIYTLTVPTGGGKTLASMRYALHHAKKHNLDRIIYVIPYTTIIEQNAEAIRDVLEYENDPAPWILEHHSNLEPEKQSWRSKVTSENWDAPIVFTTMVQFLEAMFSGGTRSVRHLHAMANAVIVFDEIQSLPIQCVHLFCNGLQWLVDNAKTTAVLCTATQPLLDKLHDPENGQLFIPDEYELVNDTQELFANLKRVDIHDCCKSSGWSEDDIVELILKQYSDKGNCLVIVNTKRWAKALYKRCRDALKKTEGLYHLSTSMCPAHRKIKLKEIRALLDKEQPVICISTQLIEAGVDVDFNCVIRYLAGLDSIAQAAGRCNRNGRHAKADVYIINPDDENLRMLPEINEGREITRRIINEYGKENLLSPEAIKAYFNYYFYNRKHLMTYPTSDPRAERNDNLLNLLSTNQWNNGRETDPRLSTVTLQQSFKTAGEIFAAIEAPTRSVIVPFDEKGRELIGELYSELEPGAMRKLLRRAQQYSVNVFPNVWRELNSLGKGALNQVPNEDVFCVNEQFYSDVYGLDTEPSNEMPLQNI